MEFIHQALKAPSTKFWREGKKILQGDPSLEPGAAIARLVDGGYPQEGATGKHAAIYVGQDNPGIQVLHQSASQGEVGPGTICWKSHRSHQSLSNDGSAF
jgi:hypothetical protein